MFMHSFKEEDTKGLGYHQGCLEALNQPEVSNLRLLKNRKYKKMVCTMPGYNL